MGGFDDVHIAWKHSEVFAVNMRLSACWESFFIPVVFAGHVFLII